MKKNALKTPFRAEKEKRDINIFLEYSELMKQKEAMSTQVYSILMKKYMVYSLSAIWRAKKRGEELLKKQHETGK